LMVIYSNDLDETPLEVPVAIHVVPT
jgi:hypothetical protein